MLKPKNKFSLAAHRESLSETLNAISSPAKEAASAIRFAVSNPNKDRLADTSNALRFTDLIFRLDFAKCPYALFWRMTLD
jgi:hypothetical protein